MRGALKEVFVWWHETGLDLLPIRKEFLRYTSRYLLPDLWAGLNVSLLVFPQALVYALLAGLPIEYGLYGAIVATIVSAIFSGSRVLNLGPTNSTAVLLLSAFSACGIAAYNFTYFLPITLVLTGTFLLISAALNIASLVRYVSKSVILGYMTAVIVIMIVNQLHNALGFDLEIVQDGSITFLDITKATLLGLKNIHLCSLGIALLTFFLCWFWKKVAPHAPQIALVIFSLSLITYFLIKVCHCPISSLEKIYVTTWEASLQGFSWDNVSLMANTAFALSFICLIDGTTILKALAARMGQRANINQMVFGMGIANILCGICSGMPASGSLVRSSANYMSGAKTSISSLFCGLFCLLGIVCFGPFFNYIPKAGLSTLIILLGIQLFERHSIKVILRSNRSDACVFIITILASFLMPLNVSIFLGVFLSIIFFLRKAAVPEFFEFTYEDGQLRQNEIGHGGHQSELSIIHVEGNLFFASAELFRDQIREVCKRPQMKVIILKLRNAFYIDASCLLAIEELLRYMHSCHRQLILSEVGSSIYKVLKQSGLLEVLGEQNVFKDDLAHLNLSTSRAMKYAQTLVGQKDMVVRVFTQKTPATTVSRLQQSLKSFVNPIKRGFDTIRDITKKQ